MSQLFPVEQSERTSDDYLTPRWVFDTLGLTFDLDVAAPPWDTHVPAARKLTKADDGLTHPWEGRVWMNPPFSNITPWVARFIEHDNGVCLLPASKSDWLLRLWRSDASWVFPQSIFRMWAEVPNGADSQVQYMVFFAAFGSECVEAIGRLGRVR
jgi:hypothetical protein